MTGKRGIKIFRSLFAKAKKKTFYRDKFLHSTRIFGAVNDLHNARSLKVQHRETLGIWLILLCHVGSWCTFQIIFESWHKEQKGIRNLLRTKGENLCWDKSSKPKFPVNNYSVSRASWIANFI